jgi:AraC-like DNA-binding protein
VISGGAGAVNGRKRRRLHFRLFVFHIAVQDLPLSMDLEILGKATRYQLVRADASDARGWFQDGPICPLLAQHHISHCGIMHAAPPFEIVRAHQSGTFMLACLDGEGVILADGQWKRIRAGQACLLPPFVMNALKCRPGKPWSFAWVRYQESRESRPIVSSLSPVSGPFDTAPLKAAIEGLHAESTMDHGASALHHWSELVHHYVLRFAQPHSTDERLWRVWQRVETDLARTWTLDELAEIACLSGEHLRRLCKKEIGRSPMQQLTHLRLQRARHLLSITDDKVEVIARAVGFESAFTFSNTFNKWIGCRPSDFR